MNFSAFEFLEIYAMIASMRIVIQIGMVRRVSFLVRL
jgi:hypothetical protein